MQATRIRKLLPENLRADLPPGNPRDAILALMEAAHAPAEQALAELDARFDPRRAPDAFVVLLAGWMALNPYLNVRDWQQGGRRGRIAIDVGRLRELTAHAAELARLRGTPAAMLRFLELATGVGGFALDSEPTGADGRTQPFHARVTAPAEARSQEQLVELIVQREKPAFATVELRWAE